MRGQSPSTPPPDELRLRDVVGCEIDSELSCDRFVVVAAEYDAVEFLVAREREFQYRVNVLEFEREVFVGCVFVLCDHCAVSLEVGGEIGDLRFGEFQRVCRLAVRIRLYAHHAVRIDCVVVVGFDHVYERLFARIRVEVGFRLAGELRFDAEQFGQCVAYLPFAGFDVGEAVLECLLHHHSDEVVRLPCHLCRFRTLDEFDARNVFDYGVRFQAVFVRADGCRSVGILSAATCGKYRRCDCDCRK